MVSGIQEIISGNPWIAPFIVFFAGLLTASNPCALGVVPLMIGSSGAYQGNDRSAWKSVRFTLVFVLGQAVALVALGLVAGLIGGAVPFSGPVWTYVMGALCVFMGLVLAEVFKLSIPMPAVLKSPKTGLFGALLLGVIAGLVSTPCAVPVLSIIFTFIASGGNVAYGGVLLAFYSLGHSVLLIVAGVSVGAAQAYINNRNMTGASMWLRRAFGLMFVAIGIYLVFIA